MSSEFCMKLNKTKPYLYCNDLLVIFDNFTPVNRVTISHIAQLRIVLYAHTTIQNMRQSNQTSLFHIRHFIDNECKVLLKEYQGNVKKGLIFGILKPL